MGFIADSKSSQISPSERKPIVLSDQKLPVEKWVSEFEMMLDENETKLDVAFHATLK